MKGGIASMSLTSANAKGCEKLLRASCSLVHLNQWRRNPAKLRFAVLAADRVADCRMPGRMR